MKTMTVLKHGRLVKVSRKDRDRYYTPGKWAKYFVIKLLHAYDAAAWRKARKLKFRVTSTTGFDPLKKPECDPKPETPPTYLAE